MVQKDMVLTPMENLIIIIELEIGGTMGDDDKVSQDSVTTRGICVWLFLIQLVEVFAIFNYSMVKPFK